MPLIGPRVILPDWSVGTVEQGAAMQAERDRLRAASFVLVRIRGSAGTGDVLRCRGCNGRHEFLTLRCIPQPFSGLQGGLFGYYHTLGVTGAAMTLSPAERARFDAVARLFDGRPDLAAGHPQTARIIATPERDVDLGAISLGILTPITKAEARRYADRINARGIHPPFTLPGLGLEV